MQTPLTDHQARELTDKTLAVAPETASLSADVSSQGQPTSEGTVSPVLFRGDYIGRMDMAAERETVARYLDDHREWFLRCAHPMTAEPLGESGYALTVGNFGALGYHVEPKLGLNLLPQESGVYRIETVQLPNYVSQGYEVDFKASLALNEQASGSSAMPLTQVEWELELMVWVHLPRFMSALPKRLVQTTGDHLLNQIVRQASRCLTLKVQEDFHQTLNLPFPESYGKRKHHFLERFSRQPDE